MKTQPVCPPDCDYINTHPGFRRYRPVLRHESPVYLFRKGLDHPWAINHEDEEEYYRYDEDMDSDSDQTVTGSSCSSTGVRPGSPYPQADDADEHYNVDNNNYLQQESHGASVRYRTPSPHPHKGELRTPRKKHAVEIDEDNYESEEEDSSVLESCLSTLPVKDGVRGHYSRGKSATKTKSKKSKDRIKKYAVEVDEENYDHEVDDGYHSGVDSCFSTLPLKDGVRGHYSRNRSDSKAKSRKSKDQRHSRYGNLDVNNPTTERRGNSICDSLKNSRFAREFMEAYDAQKTEQEMVYWKRESLRQCKAEDAKRGLVHDDDLWRMLGGREPRRRRITIIEAAKEDLYQAYLAHKIKKVAKKHTSSPYMGGMTI